VVKNLLESALNALPVHTRVLETKNVNSVPPVNLTNTPPAKFLDQPNPASATTALHSHSLTPPPILARNALLVELENNELDVEVTQLVCASLARKIPLSCPMERHRLDVHRVVVVVLQRTELNVGWNQKENALCVL
jgi:hypothetical protein